MHFIDCHLTEPKRTLQRRSAQQWFPRIGLFAIQAISLGSCWRPIKFLTSSHPCGHLSIIPNSQIHNVEKWTFLSHFRKKDFFVISHEHKDRLFVVIWPKNSWTYKILAQNRSDKNRALLKNKIFWNLTVVKSFLRERYTRYIYSILKVVRWILSRYT